MKVYSIDSKQHEYKTDIEIIKNDIFNKRLNGMIMGIGAEIDEYNSALVSIGIQAPDAYFYAEFDRTDLTVHKMVENGFVFNRGNQIHHREICMYDDHLTKPSDDYNNYNHTSIKIYDMYENVINALIRWLNTEYAILQKVDPGAKIHFVYDDDNEVIGFKLGRLIKNITNPNPDWKSLLSSDTSIINMNDVFRHFSLDANIDRNKFITDNNGHRFIDDYLPKHFWQAYNECSKDRYANALMDAIYAYAEYNITYTDIACGKVK